MWHETVTEQQKALLGLKCQSLTLIGNQLDKLHSQQGNLYASFPRLSEFNDTDFPWLDFCRNCFPPCLLHILIHCCFSFCFFGSCSGLNWLSSDLFLQELMTQNDFSKENHTTSLRPQTTFSGVHPLSKCKIAAYEPAVQLLFALSGR